MIANAVVSIQKNPPAFEEWARWHIQVCGFSDLFVFNDGAEIQVPSDLKRNITVLPLQGVQLPQNGQARQMALYNMWLYQSLGKFARALFVDDDEYLVLPEGKTVDEYYTDFLGDRGLQWVFFTSEENTDAPKDSVIRRFTHKKSRADKTVKMMLEMFTQEKNYVENAAMFVCPHCLASMRNSRMMTWYDVHDNECSGPENNVVVDVQNAPYIAHFYTKTRPEFDAKLRRGRPDTDNPQYQYWHENMKPTMERLWEERSVGDVEDRTLLDRLNSLK